MPEIPYPEGVTSMDHIGHDMKMGRFPERSSVKTFLAERATQTWASDKAAKGWQPISAAPTDGRRILGINDRREDGGAEVTWWDDGWRRPWHVNQDGTRRDDYWWPTRWVPLNPTAAACFPPPVETMPLCSAPTSNDLDTLSDAALDAAMDAFYPGEDWRAVLGKYAERCREEMRSAIAAADLVRGQRRSV